MHLVTRNKYAYPLSKRTRLYGGVEAVFNDDNAGYAIGSGSRQLPAFQLLRRKPSTAFQRTCSARTLLNSSSVLTTSSNFLKI